MKNTKLGMLAIMLLVFVMGCGPKVTTMTDTDKNLNDYKTYAYLPNSHFDVPDAMEENVGDVGKMVINEMNRNMKRAGYALDRDNPDLLVIVNTNITPQGEAGVAAEYAAYPYEAKSPVSPYFKPYYYWGYEDYNDIVGYTVDIESHFEGALEVDLVDRETRNVVWSGKAKTPIYQSNTSEALADYMEDIFDEYPTIARN